MSADELQTIRETLHRIEVAVTGDPTHGHRGIVVRLADVEKAQDEQGRKLILWGGIITGLSLAITHFKLRIFG